MQKFCSAELHILAEEEWVNKFISDGDQSTFVFILEIERTFGGTKEDSKRDNKQTK